MKIKSDKISGMNVNITVSTFGTFTVELPGEEGKAGKSIGSGQTMEEAYTRARAHIAKYKVKVEVRFLNVNGNEVVATGIHVRNQTVLAREEGVAVQIGPTYKAAGSYFAIDTPKDEFDEHIKKCAQVMQLERELRAFNEAYGVDPKKLVEAAIEQKAGV